MSIEFDLSVLPKTLRKTAQKRLMSGAIGEEIIRTIRRKIRNQGDSEYRWPDLWNHPWSTRTSDRTQPFVGTSLNAKDAYAAEEKMVGNTFSVDVYGPNVARIHTQIEDGYQTQGPNKLPLTVAPKGKKKYMIAKKGVKMRQRPIFNIAPEDFEDIQNAAQRALKG